jgi:UDP-glucose 4-epimerase
VVSVSDVATALGGRSVRVPAAAATAASAVIAKTPFVPSALEWLHVARTSMIMDTTKAKTELGWQPTHTSKETLQALADAL